MKKKHFRPGNPWYPQALTSNGMRNARGIKGLQVLPGLSSKPKTNPQSPTFQDPIIIWVLYTFSLFEYILPGKNDKELFSSNLSYFKLVS